MNFYLIPALESSADLVEHHFRGLPADAWDKPTHEGRFTPREVLAHLADWEPILLQRIKMAVQSPGATVSPYDEGQMAVDNHYSDWEPDASLNKFREERAKTVAYLQGLGDGDWNSTVLHPERGHLSVADIANMVACHDVYHMRQLMEAKA